MTAIIWINNGTESKGSVFPISFFLARNLSKYSIVMGNCRDRSGAADPNGTCSKKYA